MPAQVILSLFSSWNENHNEMLSCQSFSVKLGYDEILKLKILENFLPASRDSVLDARCLGSIPERETGFRG